MPTFYVAQKVDSGEYVSDITSQGYPVFDGDLANALWDESDSVVEQFVNRYNIENVKVKTEGGNHPGKPPISA